MDFDDFRRHFSAPRVDRYLTAAGNSTSKAVELYKANLRLYQSFHPLLSVVEVVLRNRINDTLTIHFKDPDWIINQKGGFMVDPSLTYFHQSTGRSITNDFLRKEVEKAEKRLRKMSNTVTSGKFIAEQTFGFWTDLFEVYHYKLLRGRPIQAFTTLPAHHGRKEVSQELNKIRLFRNRINHNEPVCFSGRRIDLTNASDVHKSIGKILTWIDPALLDLVVDLDEVERSISLVASI